MNVKQAEFVISAVKPSQYPKDALPEVALAGRSNVGKSSLINRMVHRKNLARTSSKPGKTQTINFYRVNGEMYFADMPGYGFARVSKETKAAWAHMIEGYLLNRRELRGVIQVVDLRHSPTRDDRMMYDWLQHHGIPAIVVATKADKIPRSKWLKHVKQVQEGLQISEDVPLILFSAETGQGKEDLWNAIAALVSKG